VDDAQAILIAISKEFSDRIEVIGITCCSGNVQVDKVLINVLKVLTAAERLDIPVYKGACKPLLRKFALTNALTMPKPYFNYLRLNPIYSITILENRNSASFRFLPI
jgi:inosine-uridine nucleoside N-ribohydrolase